ncbi:coiled-coil domain-containing protein 62 isoform X2 [Geospiza fortis]|uniref:Coiled-coil domain-containing protein 62 isoform X2 n=1 Tax=Geospiza fortis TaxID=48883 RepID=A0A8N5ESX7_GEOFO|nr:coiled-coil domain-containing protein 62 isoform X2 [Geospiza fortis]
MSSSLQRSASPQAFSPDHKNSIIRRQRQELKLLIAELKDRDKELNDMVEVHERHIQAWEDDRQKILTLAERCSSLTSELNERNAVIKSLTKKLKLLESQHNDSKITLESTQQKFKELTQKVTDSSVHCQALEDKALIETTDQITEVTSKFKTLENALRTAKLDEFTRNREHQDLKVTLNDVMSQVNKMKDILSEKMKESSKNQEEISHLKQENGCLRSELILAVEEAQRKDQLFQFAKSKQVRIERELSSLRQVCVKQQRDLHFLHVNFDSSQESRQKLENASSGKSEENVDLNSLRLASPLLASTEKSNKTQSSGKSSDEDSPLDINDLAVTKPTKRYCMNTDTSSLFWKLERSLAQSRQMLTDLELSLLHTSIPNTTNKNKRKKLVPTQR